MPDVISGFLMWIHFQADTEPPQLTIDYTPWTPDSTAPGARRRIPEYSTQMRTTLSALPPKLQRKLLRLGEYAIGLINLPEIDVAGATVRGAASLVYYQVTAGPRLSVVYRAARHDDQSTECTVPISSAAERLIDNIMPMCEQLAWDHLRERLGAPAGRTETKRKVYLTYRKGGPERLAFVTAIAERLGREGFLPWFDEWEILAGDSLPREIGAGLENVYGIVVVLTDDYPGERWAREELEGAIAQRVERSIKVIPVLYEACERPTLLQSLRYVDCTLHEADRFEHQFLQIIDALNEIELNPYR